MFALHETTRKRLCRTAFFVLCVAPTLACAAWIAYAQRPWRDADEAQRLGAVLQARTTLASFETPRPGVERASKLAITDSATGRALVTLDAWESRRHGATLAIAAGAATIELENIHAIARKVAGWIADGSSASVEIRINRLTVNLPASSPSATAKAFSLGSLVIHLDLTGSHGPRVQATARRIAIGEELPASSQIRFTSTLAALGSHHATIAIDSSAAPLPAALLAPVLDGAERLGDQCLFAGEVQLQIADGSVAGIAKGRLERADLAVLLPAGSPHRLRGEGAVDLQQLSWRDRRLSRISGSLRAEHVQASRSLMAAAVEMLLCGQPSSEADSAAAAVEIAHAADEMVALDAIACQFAWDAAGLTITGAKPSSQNSGGGELAISDGRVILFGPRFNQLSAGHWLRFVDSAATDWLPASRSAVDMAARLPLPD